MVCYHEHYYYYYYYYYYFGHCQSYQVFQIRNIGNVIDISSFQGIQRSRKFNSPFTWWQKQFHFPKCDWGNMFPRNTYQVHVQSQTRGTATTSLPTWKPQNSQTCPSVFPVFLKLTVIFLNNSEFVDCSLLSCAGVLPCILLPTFRIWKVPSKRWQQAAASTVPWLRTP
jgi:hypothetical protein